MTTSTIFAVVGERIATIGSEIQVRLSRLTSQCVTNVLGRYAESTINNHTFFVSIGAAGVAPGTALSTAPALTLWNPPNSGVLISLNQVFVGYVSGTLGAGTMVHSFNPSQVTAPTGGTALVPVPGVLGSANSKVKAFTGSTISATSAILRPSVVLGAALATSVQFMQAPAYDEVDGSIIIPPGSAWCYQGIAAAGTTPLVLIGVQYEELPFNL